MSQTDEFGVGLSHGALGENAIIKNFPKYLSKKPNEYKHDRRIDIMLDRTEKAEVKSDFHVGGKYNDEIDRHSSRMYVERHYIIDGVEHRGGPYKSKFDSIKFYINQFLPSIKNGVVDMGYYKETNNRNVTLYRVTDEFIERLEEYYIKYKPPLYYKPTFKNGILVWTTCGYNIPLSYIEDLNELSLIYPVIRTIKLEV